MDGFLRAEDAARLAERYNRSCFLFSHRLHELDIFDIENLIEVSKRVPDAYFATGDAAIGDGWGTSGGKITLHQTLAEIGRSNALVLMKGLADDPEFAPVFRQVLGEIVSHVGSQLSTDVTVSRATLVISSPHRVTPYHIDAETNYLFQLRGKKIVNVFDPTDRTLLTDIELERYFSGGHSAASYKPDRQGDASVFTFAPGDGLHIPILSPHWTQNGPSVSVAISVNLSLRSNERLAQLYKFNHRLRKLGLRPSPPGARPWQDRLKIAAVQCLRYARRSGRAGTTMNTL
jgi:hypothetical protein